jgi:RNA polymerase sigma-32 factor
MTKKSMVKKRPSKSRVHENEQQEVEFNDNYNKSHSDSDSDSDSDSENEIENDLDENQVEIDSFLPTAANNLLDIAKAKVTQDDVKQIDALKAYIKSISRYTLLSPEEEKNLTQELVKTGDIEIAKKLVVANLRLVVKIAMEYRHSYQNILDLIQEGNIGLMKAVSKYNPDSGAKLSYYASWWIRSYILKFILDNFRLVKIGTTHDQKKLFYNLLKEKERLMAQGINPEPKLIAQNLHVAEKAVIEMDNRLNAGGAEVSIDKAHFDDSGMSFHDILPSNDEDVSESLAFSQGLEILKNHMKSFLDGLKDRDREIFEKRLLAEVPLSLQAIADQYGVSRERIRQVESRLMDELKVYMGQYIR